MKKNKVFFGLALLGIAFSGAAFTANKTMQSNHYIQKPNECAAIPETTCETPENDNCLRSDGTGTYQVFEQQVNPSTCDQPLHERLN